MFTRQGFLRVTADTSVSSASIAYVGHVFGRLGQGQLTMPAISSPFFWGTPQTSNNPGMMISVIPEADNNIGLGDASMKIEIVA